MLYSSTHSKAWFKPLEFRYQNVICNAIQVFSVNGVIGQYEQKMYNTNSVFWNVSFRGSICACFLTYFCFVFFTPFEIAVLCMFVCMLLSFFFQFYNVPFESTVYSTIQHAVYLSAWLIILYPFRLTHLQKKTFLIRFGEIVRLVFYCYSVAGKRSQDRGTTIVVRHRRLLGSELYRQNDVSRGRGHLVHQRLRGKQKLR